MQLPVDVHGHRVAGRLSLIGKRVPAEVAHELLRKLLPDDAQAIDEFHKYLLHHGQRICIYSIPRCWECSLADLCDDGRASFLALPVFIRRRSFWSLVRKFESIE
jgi:endonuclease-3